VGALVHAFPEIPLLLAMIALFVFVRLLRPLLLAALTLVAAVVVVALLLGVLGLALSSPPFP
jgi:hypothetical protein